MKKSCALLIASLLGVASCEESESQCAAACIASSSLRLHKTEWAEGEHELIVRYPRYDGMHEVRCVIELPKSDAAITCEDDGEDDDPMWVSVSVDATVNVHLMNHEAGDIQLEIVPPEGESLTKTVRPAYTFREVCGQRCVTGDDVVDLDE